MLDQTTCNNLFVLRTNNRTDLSIYRLTKLIKYYKYLVTTIYLPDRDTS